MGRRVLILCAVVVLASIAPAALGATAAGVNVSPRAGGPSTTFVVSVRNPFTTAAVSILQRSETVGVTGPHRSGCVWSGAVPVPPAPAQQPVRVALSPSRLSGTGTGTGATKRWCRGTFHGDVIMTERFVCKPPLLCPMLAIRPQTIARFTFRVKARA